MASEIVKWILASVFAVFAFAILLAEANCGPHWFEEVEVSIGNWLLRLWRGG